MKINKSNTVLILIVLLALSCQKKSFDFYIFNLSRLASVKTTVISCEFDSLKTFEGDFSKTVLLSDSVKFFADYEFDKGNWTLAKNKSILIFLEDTIPVGKNDILLIDDDPLYYRLTTSKSNLIVLKMISGMPSHNSTEDFFHWFIYDLNSKICTIQSNYYDSPYFIQDYDLDGYLDILEDIALDEGKVYIRKHTPDLNNWGKTRFFLYLRHLEKNSVEYKTKQGEFSHHSFGGRKYIIDVKKSNWPYSLHDTELTPIFESK